MKSNFIISRCMELWEKDADSYVFLTEDVMLYAIENGIDEHKCRLSPAITITGRDFVQVVGQYLEKYLPILAYQLHRIHGKTVEFWLDAAFLYLRDLIASAYDLFIRLEATFDPTSMYVVSANAPIGPPLYGVSSTLTDAAFWAITDRGREYYASEYFSLFYPEFYEWRALNVNTSGRIIKKQQTSILQSIALRVRRLVEEVKKKRARVLVLDVMHSRKFAVSIQLKTLFRVSFISDTSCLETLRTEPHVDERLRDEIASHFHCDDSRFDRFLGRCVRSSLPWSYLEGFEDAFGLLDRYWRQFPQIRYLISENLYQGGALSRAVCASQKAEVIEIQHFFPLHIFKASNISEVKRRRKSIASGPASRTSDSIGVGTVYRYRIDSWCTRNSIAVLYVATDFYPYFNPLQTLTDGSGYEVCKQYAQLTERFFKLLPMNVRSQIRVKKRVSHSWLYTCGVSYPADMEMLDPNLPASDYISRSRLVISEGLSTSLLESLYSNIPVIAFWPADMYALAAEYRDYFAELEDVGIIVHCPRELADRVSVIATDPQLWWKSDEVRLARKNFLSMKLNDERQFAILAKDLAKWAS